MSYIIIVVVMAVVLSPIFWMMPSPKQKRQMQLRQHAMNLGLQVKICDLPQTERAKVRREPVVQGVIYRLPWRSKQRDVFQHIVQRSDLETEPFQKAGSRDWQTLVGATLAALPDTVVAIEYATAGLAIFWREQGDVDFVESLKRQLQQLQQQLHAPG
ncbi:hypothetical protein [Oceanicoccus sp. KOV_DT_Chl]|uniref:hypothetical protein n=1 Tax=Oceanicoccus sp. KOV_DT_Chl TaxID=1904639 RepID=UPI0011AF23E3|nr:hypothetical protein [Oceanicoccus sp. KOV_DT_Chl]